MKLQDILVVVGDSARAEAVVALAAGIAQRHDAHLTGLCPMELLVPFDFRSALAGYPEFVAVQTTLAQFENDAREKAQSTEARFREMLRRQDIRGDWQLAEGRPAAVVARRARTTDLLVIGQADPAEPVQPVAQELVGDTLMTSGRPLLLVPYAGKFETVGDNVLIAWNGSREAARAVHDALPLIQPTAIVTVLTVLRSSSEPEDIPGAEIAAHLARHGLNVSAARTFIDGSISEADAMLNYASDIGADLLVTGGYGRSRAREMILGGVSRDLLDHMTLPVLMSH